MKLPKVLINTEYEVIKPKPKSKSVYINGVEVIVSPDVVVKAKINGQYVYGAVKFHISSGKTFDLQQSRIVATSLSYYLNTQVINDGEIVNPEMCFSIDIFSGKIVSAISEDTIIRQEINALCKDISIRWNGI